MLKNYNNNSKLKLITLKKNEFTIISKKNNIKLYRYYWLNILTTYYIIFFRHHMKIECIVWKLIVVKDIQMMHPMLDF